MQKKGHVVTKTRLENNAFFRLKNQNHLQDIRESLSDLSVKDVDNLLQSMIEKYNLPYEEVVNLFRQKSHSAPAISVPLLVFREKRLTHLQSLVKYLRESENVSLPEIALLLARDVSAVSQLYSQAKHLTPEPFQIVDDEICVPIAVFKDRNLSILEHLAEFLKDTIKLRYSEIARLLDRDQRTVWTAYVRGKDKRLRLLEGVPA
ncbi:MAG: hypothetical protein V1837_02630 [Candidatus Woesearchaeota archaeon]